MKERPLLFKAEMVRAALADLKTNTRRLNGLDAINQDLDPEVLDSWRVQWSDDGHSGPAWYFYCDEYKDEGSIAIRCPYGVPGDRLWVRETWCPADCMYGMDADPPQTIGYPADKSATMFDGARKPHAVPSWDVAQWNWATLKGKPSIHMARWASRLTLEVTSVRVERLQDISEEDARAEGVAAPMVKEKRKLHPVFQVLSPYTGPRNADHVFRCEFAALWDEINKKRAPWASNPWVWVIEFKRVVSGRKSA